MTRPVLSPSLLARQTPEVRAILAKTPRVKRDTELAPVTSTVTRDGDRIVVVLAGLALRLTQNSRCHWARKARVVKHQRRAVFEAMRAVYSDPPDKPLVVTLVRVGPKLLDSDNAVGALKATRDAVAMWLDVDDGSDEVTWIVQQERGPYAVRIVIAPGNAPK